MTGEPAAAGELAGRAAELMRRAPLHRATPAVLEPDDPEVVAIAEARADARAAHWSLVVPSRFQWATLDDFTEAAVIDPVREWAANPAGRNLVLLGPVGVGKSHLATAAARTQHERGREVRWLPVVELLDLLRPGGPDGALYDLADVDVLVLDDLLSEKPTDWTVERLYALVNRRWLEERPTVVTANLDPGPLEAAMEPRTYSRLVGSAAVAVRLSGPDRRRQR